MSENKNLGVVMEFEAEAEFEDGETIVMTPSRPSKAEALAIGWSYYEADEQTQDAMLAEFGAVLVRRSLQAFGNYAARTNERDVAEYAAMLRDEITLVRGDEAAS